MRWEDEGEERVVVLAVVDFFFKAFAKRLEASKSRNLLRQWLCMLLYRLSCSARKQYQFVLCEMCAEDSGEL